MVYYLLGVVSCSKRVVAGNEEATSYTSSKLYYEPPIPPHANYISFAMSCASTDAYIHNINAFRTLMLLQSCFITITCTCADLVPPCRWHVTAMGRHRAPTHLCRAQTYVACCLRRLSQYGSRQ